MRHPAARSVNHLPLLEIQDLHASVEGKPILKGISLRIESGEVHALMGPNGSGKSTLSNVLMGHPKYKVESGRILFEGRDVAKMAPDQRARAGMFLAFQYPLEIDGVNFEHLLQQSQAAIAKGQGRKVPTPSEFRKLLEKARLEVGLDGRFLERAVNAGFSGGEKKRAEVLQLALLKPKLAILDETDSGLDIDSLKAVAEAVGNQRGPHFAALVITHYQRILGYLKPDRVHVMLDGAIVRSGGPELVHELESKGYSWLAKPAKGGR